MNGKIASVIWQAKNTLYLLIRLEQEMSISPGTFVNLTYKGTTRSYTCCNFQPTDTLELFIKLKEGGEMSGKLESAMVGEPVEVEGPFREPPVEGKRLLLIAGGSGLAAFIPYVRENELRGERDIVLFVSSKRLVEVGFLGELLRLQKSRAVITLTREEAEGFEHGHITREMVEKYTDLNREVYACGSKAFAEAMAKQFEGAQVFSW